MHHIAMDQSWSFKFLHLFGLPLDAGRDYTGTEITQHLGNVTSQEGRLVTFPNRFQHRVEPFSLLDRSKPGHRKILALFLVDPHRRIISSANVPPQREDWCGEWVHAVQSALRRLPLELQYMVYKELGSFGMSMEEAKGLRMELREDWASREEGFQAEYESGSFLIR